MSKFKYRMSVIFIISLIFLVIKPGLNAQVNSNNRIEPVLLKNLEWSNILGQDIERLDDLLTVLDGEPTWSKGYVINF